MPLLDPELRNVLDLIDSHSHLDAAEFDADRPAVLRRAREAGVDRQIVPAVAFATFPGLRDLCAAESGIYPAYGLHPMYLAAHKPGHLEELARNDRAKLCRQLKVDADDLDAAIALIRSLDPKPGAQIDPGKAEYVAPDAYAFK